MAKKKTNKPQNKVTIRRRQENKKLRLLLFLALLGILLFIMYPLNKDYKNDNNPIKTIQNTNPKNSEIFDWTKEKLIKITGSPTNDNNLREFTGNVEYNTVKISIQYPSSWEVYSQKGMQHIFYPEGKDNEKLVSLNISGLGSGIPPAECIVKEFPASMMNYCLYDREKDGVQYRNRAAWTKDDKPGDIIFRMEYPLEKEGVYKEIFDNIISSLKIRD